MTDTVSKGSGGIPAANSGSDGAGLLESRPFPRITDLTLTLHPGMRGVTFEPKHNFKEHGWNALTLQLYSHCGTHMDAPSHREWIQWPRSYLNRIKAVRKPPPRRHDHTACLN